MGLTSLPHRTPQPVVAAVTINPSGPMPAQETSTKRDYIFIVNPNGANGYTGKEWKRIFPKLQSRLGSDWNVCQAFTSGPSHAVEIAREAVQDGAAAVIAVGGDGTLHEVLNGFFADGKLVQPKELSQPRTALGLIPLGTGSDFARTFGWKNDPYQAIDRIAKGQRRKIDVGRVVYGDNLDRYFLNVADVHLSAKAGFYAAKWKRFGNFCYVIGALQGFVGHQNRDLNVRINGGEWHVVPKVTAVAIGNARFFGGGMKITPTADPFSGSLEVVTLRNFKWYDFVLRFYKLYQGTHVELRNVSVQSVHTIEIEEVNDRENLSETFVQADGEYLGYLQATFSVIPGSVDFLV